MRKQQTLARIRETTPGVALFLTVTINPKLNSHPARYQFCSTYTDVIHILNIYCRDYSLIAETTLEACIHYHAWVVLRNPQARPVFMNKLKKSKNLGYVKLNKDYITDTKRVYYYMLDPDNTKQGANVSMAYDLVDLPEVVTNYTPLIYTTDPILDTIRDHPNYDDTMV